MSSVSVWEGSAGAAPSHTDTLSAQVSVGVGDVVFGILGTVERVVFRHVSCSEEIWTSPDVFFG